MQVIQKIVIHGWDFFTASIAENIRYHFPEALIYCPDVSNEATEQAIQEGYLNINSDRKALIYEDADYIFLNHPHDECVHVLKSINACLNPETYIIDFIDIKSSHGDTMRELLDKRNPYISFYVFSDSMLTGVRRDFFKDKIVAVMGEHTSKILSDIKAFWDLFGAKMVPTSADFFDEIFAETVQGPNILATIYSSVLQKDSWADTLFFGFYNKILRDFVNPLNQESKIIAGNLIRNRENIKRTLSFMQREISYVSELIEEENLEQLEQYIQRAKSFKNRI